jgi:hypothetical protein
MVFEVSSCEEAQLQYRICPVIDGTYSSPICWGDSQQIMMFICNELNRTLVDHLRDDSNISPEMICELMGIVRSP